MKRLWLLSALTAVGVVSTNIHEPGMCAMYGNCGKKSLFGGELPCPNSVPAQEPDTETRDALVDICGEEWAEGAVCCTLDQINNLKSNLKKAESIIASCPACKQNFFQFFCRFTCHPDQSTFVDVLKTETSKSGKQIVTELDHYASPEFASGFYDSCKEVKFSATNGYAMDFIGGGAKDYKAFLKFLGDEKPLLGGSPFQMNFPWGDDQLPEGVQRGGPPVRNCSDPDYRCACSDCPESCPTLPALDSPDSYCKVGAIPCFSFAVLMGYTGALVLLVLGYGGWLAWKRQEKRNWESRRLLVEDEMEDNDDDDYISHRLGMLGSTPGNETPRDRLQSPIY